MTTATDLKPDGNRKKSAARLSKDGKWRSFPKAPRLLQYVSSGTYYARLHTGGKIIRQSLETTVWSTAQLKLVDCGHTETDGPGGRGHGLWGLGTAGRPDDCRFLQGRHRGACAASLGE